MTTLQSIMRQEDVTIRNYLKMDCEGAEYDILSSVPVEVARRIEQISIEIHKIPGHDPSEIHQKLEAFGFSQISKEHVHYFRPRRKWADAERSDCMVCDTRRGGLLHSTWSTLQPNQLTSLSRFAS